MAYIGIDTNIWIYLAKSSFSELWDKLRSMNESNEVKIFITDIILLEWDRNKEKTISTIKDDIKLDYKRIKELAKLSSKKEKFNSLTEEFNTEAFLIAKASDKVEEIDSFLRNKCIVLETSDSDKLYISDLVINNTPPFNNKKNHFNDALIIRTLCKHIAKNNYVIKDLIFVSNNPSDFIDKETKEVYLSLLEGVSDFRFQNVLQLAHALRLAPSLVDEIDEWLENQLETHYMTQFDISRGK